MIFMVETFLEECDEISPYSVIVPTSKSGATCDLLPTSLIS